MWVGSQRTSSMSASCCGGGAGYRSPDPGYQRAALWLVLVINATMFAVEIGAGLAAGSASLQADALDFLGDAGNYAIREPRRIGRSESFGLGLSGRATRSCWGGAAFGPFFSLPAPLRERFTPLYADSTHELSSSGRRHHPLELHKAAHVVDQVHEPDLRASACHADGAHELAAHGVLLIAKDVLDAGAHP